MFGLRRLVVPAAIVGLVLAMSAGTGAAAPRLSENSPWAQTNADAAATRGNQTEHVLGRSTLSRVRPLRNIIAPSRPRGSTCYGANGASSPVLTGNRVYGIFNDRLAAYDAATGRRLWQGPGAPLQGFEYTSVSVSGSLVVVGWTDCNDFTDLGGGVAAVNANTGVLVWSTYAYAGVLSAAVYGSTVVTYDFSGLDGAVEAYDLRSGHRLWRAANECVDGFTVVGGLVVLNSCTAEGPASTVALYPRTGETARQFPSEYDYIDAGDQAGPAARHLYVSNYGDTFVTDVNPATGAVLGTLPGSTRVLAVARTRVFTSCSAGICAYLQSTHRLSWAHAVPAQNLLVAAANGLLYLSDGTVLSAYTGHVLRRLFNPPAVALAVGDGRIADINPNTAKTLRLFGLAGY